MTAKDAKELVNDYRSFKNCLQQVLGNIQERARDGGSHLTFFSETYYRSKFIILTCNEEKIIENLQRLGFKVQKGSYCEFKVSWD